jgi:hypothetical protein
VSGRAASCIAPGIPGPGDLLSAGRVRVRDIDAATYKRHFLHDEDRTWPETNCYVDLWIELMHGIGLDPMPALAFTLALDFEGDQYTFYKFGHTDLRDLYGIEVQEINIWKPLVEHAIEQTALGRVLIPEMDSFWLPDTAGVSYQISHTKSSIAIMDIDIRARRLGYFHGKTYYELSGADFDGVFRLAPGLGGPNVLPPFTEIAKLDALKAQSTEQIKTGAVALARRYIERRPKQNPIARHRDRFPADLEWMRASADPNLFHNYAFATFRQLGSCFEVAADFLRWLAAHGENGLDGPIAECSAIATTSKSFQFKLARAVTLKRDVDFSGAFDSMVANWDSAMAQLVARYGS